CGMVYILDQANKPAIVEKIRSAFSGVEGIASVVGPEEMASYGVADPRVDPNAPAMLLFAKLGYAFRDTAAGALTFSEQPERKGPPGHDPHLPELHAAFVAWGEGIRSGSHVGEIPNTRVAPTIARLLNLTIPNAEAGPITEVLK